MISYADWIRCKPWIEASTKESAFCETIATIEQKLFDGKYRLASSPNAAAVIELCRYGENEVLLVRFAGGSIDELMNLIEPPLYAEAKATGRLMMGEGRLGWMKHAKAHGYRLAWITMVKD